MPETGLSGLEGGARFKPSSLPLPKDMKIFVMRFRSFLAFPGLTLAGGRGKFRA